MNTLGPLLIDIIRLNYNDRFIYNNYLRLTCIILNLYDFSYKYNMPSFHCYLSSYTGFSFYLLDTW